MTGAASRGTALAAVLALALAACTSPAQRVEQRENLLAAAGFVQQPANTPERVAALRRLPPHHFVRRVEGNQVTWLYADPTICGCLYAGTQQAYDRYRREVFEKKLANEQELAAQMSEEAAYNWNWGPWGYGWWY
ncbi:MAG TPA: hypothetical protein VE684_07705 [Crenalkalicoccus sp.]|jgi:hypothetical protein|nr:hypothetical protein [Crenalkalicoccus sp.]